MRATSPPTALPVAAAALALVVAALAPLAVPSSALAERWLRPVPGEVARPFSYARAAPFAAGAHRGADLIAAPGTPVRSVCAGRVLHAGPVAGLGVVVSVRCGRRRVTYLPLASLAVRVAPAVAAGAPVGVVAAGHGGLHIGVRREGDRFAYEDPVALFAPPANTMPPAAARRPRPARPDRVRFRAPLPADRAPLSPERAASPGERVTLPAERASLPGERLPLPAGLLDARPRFSSASARAQPPPMPTPIWVGLGLLLAAAAGSGAFAVRRRRRLPARAVATADVAC